VATIIDQKTSGAAPWMPINRGIRLRAKGESWERERRAKDVRNVGESGLPRQPAVAAIAALRREK